MTAPDLKRLLFFASETSVLGVIVASLYFGQQAKYVEPIMPVFCLGCFVLFVVSFGCVRPFPVLACVGFASVGLAVLWAGFLPMLVA